MDGLSREAVGNVPRFTDTDWAVPGLDDFTGDGLTDLLWHNEVTGPNKIWPMQGFTRAAQSNIPKLADTQWEVQR